MQKTSQRVRIGGIAPIGSAALLNAIAAIVSYSLSDLPATFWLLLLVCLAVIASNGVVLVRLGIRASLPHWLVLSILVIGHFLRAVYFAYFDSAYELNPTMSWVTIDTIHRGLAIATAGFSLYFVGAFLLLRIQFGSRLLGNAHRESQDYRGEELVKNHQIPFRQLSFVLLAYAAALVLLLYLGLPVMGQETVRLPLRIDTVSNRLVREILPSLLLTLVWLWDRGEQRWQWFVAVGVYVCVQFTNAFVSTSRAGFILPAFYLICLWAITGKATARRMSVLLVMFLASVALIPLVSLIRTIAIAEGGRQGAWSVSRVGIDRGDVPVDVEVVANYVFGRLTGADSLWWIVRDPVPASAPLEVGMFWGDLTMFYTTDILGLSGTGDYRAPGIVGAGVLLGGIEGGIALMTFLGCAVSFIWGMLARAKAFPVIGSLMAAATLFFIMEGTMRLQDLLFVSTVCVCVSIYAKKLCSAYPDIMPQQAVNDRSIIVQQSSPR